MTKASPRPHEPIAIVGIGCRFPGGASSPARLWELLLEGREATVEVPRERWDARRFYDPDPEAPGKTYVKAGGFLQEPIDAFDASCFEISPREASALDPQQRVLMEVAWEALEDAGIPAARLAGSDTGVYIGAFMLDQMLSQMGPMNREVIGPHTAVGATMTILANRLSYLFDLRGPSFSLDTACSSSLVAVHQACQDLWRGGCSLALAGGVNVMFRPELWVAMCKGKFLAPDGRCKSFDAAADGYARGEGAGVLVLKRASEAERDGDRIWALIRATGVNQDGRTVSITQPNPEAQEALVRRVCSEAGVEPSQIPYFEAHGTGTAAGDPLELKAIGAARAGAAAPAYVGSVKANLGHLEAAAGVAGLIKAALCLRHGRVPGQPNLTQPNPAIPFDALGLQVPRASVALERRGGEPLRAGVNAFGYGGTNAHALLEEAPRREENAAAGGLCPGLPLFLTSAKSLEALKARARDDARALREPGAPPLEDLCFSAARRRDHLQHRIAVGAESSAALAERLEAFAAQGSAEGAVSGRAFGKGRELAPVFVFTGMGPQWWAMGQELLSHDPAFRAVLERCDAAFSRLSGWSLLAQMRADEARSRMAETDVAQPANFFLQVGLFDLWRRRGVEPAAIVGHSAGEVAAAHCAGALDLEQAVQAIYERSRLQKTTAGRGRMLAIGATPDDARALLRGKEAWVSIAAINGPRTLTLSGEGQALEAIAFELTARGAFNKFLRVEVPYHSPCMDELKPEMRRCLAGLAPRTPTVPIWSTVTGRRAGEGAFAAEYWCDNIREPTLFAEAMKGLVAEGYRTFLEVGPHPVLAAAIAECLREAGAEGRVFSSLRRGEKEQQTLLGSLSSMHVAGVEVDWARAFPEGRFAPLPTYPWQRERFWGESPEALADRLGAGEHALLGPRCATPTPTWERGMNGQYLACLSDHKVQGAVVVPGAAYLEMAIAAREALGMKPPHVLDDVAFVEALVVPRGDEPVVRTSFDAGARSLEIASRPRDARAFRRHAAVRLSSASRPEREQLDLAALRARIASPLTAEELYARLAARGLQYGPRLRGLRELWVAGDELLARVEPCEGALGEPALFLDPAFLDPCLQALVALLPAGDRRLFLPVGCEQVRAYRPARGALVCYAVLTERGPERVVGQILLAQESGEVVARLSGVACAAVGAPASKDAERWTYRHAWEEAPLAAPNETKEGGRWLLFLDAAGEGSRLARALAGGSGQGVVTAFPGEGFGQESASSFRLRPGSLEDARRLLAAPELAQLRGAVYLWTLDTPADPADAAGLAGASALLRVAQALGERGASAPRLYVVTRGAQRAEPGDRGAALFAASAAGIARVAASERPALRSTLVDLPEAPCAEALARELMADASDDDVALRPPRRLARRLRAAPLPEWEALWEREREEASRASPGATPFALEIDPRKPLAPPRLRARRRREPGRGEVEIEVGAAAIAPGWPLELEGFVARVGPGVEDLRPGEAVAGLVAPQPAESHVIAPLDRACLRAVALGEPAALAGRLLPMTLASWSLEEAARLANGEILLVLGDARGVGAAAAQLGAALGAKVLAAAEGPARKRLQRLRGLEVLDAGSADLRRELLSRTDGRGVDVVVDASGEAAPSLARALSGAPRLVELAGVAPNGEGRGDPSALATAALARGAACFRADPLALLERREPLDVALARVFARLASGALSLDTVALESHPAAEVAQALQASAASGGAVNLLLRGGPPVGLLPEAPSGDRFKPEGTYLVTGGLGGFGLRVARWLVARGARRLLLVGRSGAASSAAQAEVAALRALGAKVEVASLDVSQEAPLRALLARLEAEAPLAGVFHAAAVLDDAPLEAMDEARLARSSSAKAQGAWHLHQLTRDKPLDAFVLFSSISALIGNPRQANYVAANCFLDALAEHRAALGLPALSVHWGVLAEVGMAADASVRDYLRGLGLSPMSPEAALSALERALRLGEPQVAIADVDWEALARSAPHLRRSARLSTLVPKDGGAAGAGPAVRLRALALEERRAELAKLLGDQVARALQLDRARVDPDKPLTSLGVDSLLAMQLQDLVRREIGLEVPALELLRGGSVLQLAEGMAKALEGSGTELRGGAAATAPLPTSGQAAPPPPTEKLEDAVARQVEGLSEAEVEAMLQSLTKENDEERRP